MVMEDEFQKLMKFFSDSLDGKQVDIGDVMNESMGFFNDLKEKIEKGSDEERAEMLSSINEMYGQLMGESKKLCEKAGLSEEQLAAFLENPSNFTNDQWEQMQSARGEIQKTTDQLIKTLNPGAANQAQKNVEQKKPQDKKKGEDHGPTPPRSDWIKS